MAMDSLHPQDDFSSRFFIWHEWIQANGPLTRKNALDYFATSMFYDKQSNNQVLRMQTMHTGMPLENEAEDLKRFTGLEFALVHDEAPTLFVIYKQDRLSADEVRPLTAYFIMHNRIYQAPDVYNVVSNRLASCLNLSSLPDSHGLDQLAAVCSLQASLDNLLSHKPDFTPRNGFLWPIAPGKSVADSETSSKKQKDGSMDEDFLKFKQEKTVVKKQENATLLFNAMRTTAAQTHMGTVSQGGHSFADSAEQTQVQAPATPGVPEAPPEPTEQPSIATQDAISKAPPGGGKKKRKRTLMAPA